jgi:hypothetical protein
MTINTDQTLKLLQASVEREAMKKEIAALKATVQLQEAQITALQCRLQRSHLPFDKRTPALLRPQAG